jgi:hypothetical protein
MFCTIFSELDIEKFVVVFLKWLVVEAWFVIKGAVVL